MSFGSQKGRLSPFNGQAREEAANRGWVDGKTVLEPAQLLEKLNTGLRLCGSGSTLDVQPNGSQTADPLVGVPRGATPPASEVKLSIEDLSKAVRQGDTNRVSAYVGGRFDLNRRYIHPNSFDAIGATPVEIASASGQCSMLKMLLEAGARPDNKVAVGLTALSLASSKGHVDCVRVLIQSRVRLDVRETVGGDTPLILAAYQGHLEVVRALVDAGASLSTKNRDGVTPYRAAKAFGNNAVAAYLSSKGGR